MRKTWTVAMGASSGWRISLPVELQTAKEWDGVSHLHLRPKSAKESQMVFGVTEATGGPGLFVPLVARPAGSTFRRFSVPMTIIDMLGLEGRGAAEWKIDGANVTLTIRRL